MSLHRILSSLGIQWPAGTFCQASSSLRRSTVLSSKSHPLRRSTDSPLESSIVLLPLSPCSPLPSTLLSSPSSHPSFDGRPFRPSVPSSLPLFDPCTPHSKSMVSACPFANSFRWREHCHAFGLAWVKSIHIYPILPRFSSKPPLWSRPVRHHYNHSLFLAPHVYL